MDRELQILLKLKDDASKELDKFNDKTKSTGISLGKLGGIFASVFATKKIIDFGISSVQAFQEGEVQMQKFETSLKSLETATKTVVVGQKNVATGLKYSSDEISRFNLQIESANIALKDNDIRQKELFSSLAKGKITNEQYRLSIEKIENNKKQLSATISELNSKISEQDTKTVDITKQVKVYDGNLTSLKETILKTAQEAKKLAFEDEDVSNGLVSLVRSTGDINKALELNKLAMDIARGKGVEYSEAVKTVQLALAGSTKELRSMGYEIDENITSTQVLSTLQGTYAGQAESFAQTSTGAMQILTIAVDDLKKALGSTLNEALLPLIQEFTKWLQDPGNQAVLKILIDAIGIFLKGAILSVKIVFDALVLTFNDFWSLAKEIGKGIYDGVVKPFVAIKEAIESVITAITNLISKFKELSVVKGISSFVGNVVGGAGIVGNAIKSAFVNDAIISPNGNIISTHPDDYLIATKNPASLAGGGVVINVYGDVSGSELVDKVQRAIMGTLKLNTAI